jgi:hypothetical protein
MKALTAQFLVCGVVRVASYSGIHPSLYNEVPPGIYHKVLVALDFRLSCRKVGITTTQHRLNFAEKSQPKI